MALHQASQYRLSAELPRVCTLDTTKLLAWTAGAIIPWAIISLAARAFLAAFH